MPVLLGLDTGGTYTDAVLFDPARGVLAAAKALTTKHDLAIGLSEAIERILPLAPQPVALVSLSTTLATNAIVEGQGGRVCLLLLGYDRGALDRAGLGAALGTDPVEFIAGGHDAFGEEQAALDLAAARRLIARHAEGVDAFAVSGFFSVRNPAHELAVRDLVREIAGRPVTCGHELTSKLDAPRRALTAALNARLIPDIHRLVGAVRATLARKGVAAPLMVVKGDGALTTAEAALLSPVETILSGPAASLVGARHLAGATDALVADMGGTTTDIALLRGGRPVVAAEGARVGGWRTMVEAVAVHTVGLGGDSEVALGEAGEIRLGPRRLVPLSLLVSRHPALQDRLAARLAGEPDAADGRFVLRQRPLEGRAALSRVERAVWQALAEGPVAEAEIGKGYAARQALALLVERGLVAVAGFTPTDAAHLLGRQRGWSVEAAALGARLLARRRPGGSAEREDAMALAAAVLERAVVESGKALLEAMLGDERVRDLRNPESLAYRLAELALGESPADGAVAVAFALRRPLVAIGAPAASYYPAVAERLQARLVLPPHGEVCNAVGAVAGGVSESATVVITAPDESRYRVHLPLGVTDFAGLEAAVAHAAGEAGRLAAAKARRAGAAAVELREERAERCAEGRDGRPIFVEMRITATAFGRPRLADEAASAIP